MLYPVESQFHASDMRYKHCMIDYHNLNRDVGQLTSAQYLADHPRRNASVVSKDLAIVANISLSLNYTISLRY